jgi:AcrR family transcriptional regulator
MSSEKNTRTRILAAALALIRRRRGADVSLGEIARAARLSRQAIYLHFTDRAGLLTALLRYADEARGLPEKLREINEAPSGVAALQGVVALQASDNPALWPLARVFDAVRRSDPAVERSWQDRLEDRLSGCRAIVVRLQAENSLRHGLDPNAAADLLWTITSLRMWEDLVIQRGWSAEKYRQYVNRLLLASITNVAPSSEGQQRKRESSGHKSL